MFDDNKTRPYLDRIHTRRAGFMAKAASQPKRYRAKVFALSVLCVLVPALILLSLTGLLIHDTLAMILSGWERILPSALRTASIVVIASLGAALWILRPKPQGIEITKSDAPSLFAMIREVQNAVKGPDIARVFISDEVNAHIEQVPQKKKFWKTDNYLTLGLPLLNLLTPDELKAVIAHEFGHLCAGDGKIGNWMFRAGTVIGRLEHQYETQGMTLFEMPIAFCVNRFGRAYLDRVFPLMRQQELAADAMAARVTGSDHLASALLRLQIGANYMHQQFWPWVKKRTLFVSAPDVYPIRDSANALMALPESDQTLRWLNEGLLTESDYEDSHPCLMDRLNALRVDPFYPVQNLRVAATLLGRSHAALTSELDNRWRDGFAGEWAAAHDKGQKDRVNYNHMASKMRTQGLTLKESIEFIELSQSLLESDQVYQNLGYLLQVHGDAGEAWLEAGRVLLEDGNPQCIAYLQHATELNSTMLSTVRQMMAHHYREMGDEAAVRALAA